MADTTPPPRDIDLQVNGYRGVDFNREDLTAEDLHAACVALHADGVARILPTIITEDLDIMAARLRRLVELREQDPLAREVIAGLHIEGPFINPEPGYAGAHPKDAIRPAEPDLMRRLLDAGGGLVRIVTLAPEHDAGASVTRLLADQGVIVSAGHCNPDAAQLDRAIDAGLSMFTHLGNGCPMTLHRHDNIIQRALARADKLWLCFIADGIHIPFDALRNYLAIAGERAIVVTDAMSAAGLGPGRHRISRWEVEVDEHLAAWAPDRSHLVGSAMTMPAVRNNLRTALQLSEAQIDRLIVTHPAAALDGRLR